MILWLALAAAGAWLGSRRLDADVDVLALLPQDDPEVCGMRLMREHFQAANELLILIEAAAASDAGDAAAQLLADEELASLASEIRMLSNGLDADRGGAVLAWAWQNASPGLADGFVKKLTGSELTQHLDSVTEKLATTPDAAEMQRWSYDPLGLLNVLGDGGESGLPWEAGADSDKAQILTVRPRERITSYREAVPWLNAVRERASAVAKSMQAAGRPVTVSFTGEIAFMAEAGGSMERDLSTTIGGSTVLIAALFWLMYRRLMPLVFIVLILTAVLGITIGIGSLVLGGINVMNLGFAAIVLGLVADYGAIIYQESAGTGSPAEIRSHVGRSIIGGAATTAAVFLLLCLSSFPGLKQLGLLVAIGVAAGAAIMLVTFPGIAVRFAFVPGAVALKANRPPAGFRWTGTAVLLVMLAIVFLWKGMPGFDGSPAPLRPRNSEAMQALEKIERTKIADDSRRVPLLIAANSLPELRALISKQETGWLPAALLPDAEAQAANRKPLQILADQEPQIVRRLDEAGFTQDSSALFSAFLRHLRESLAQPGPVEIEASSASSLLGKFISRKAAGWAVLGWTERAGNQPGRTDPGAHTPGWESLGRAMSRIAIHDALTRMLPLAIIILAVLFAVFRSWREVALTVAALIAGFAALFAMMSLTGQSWNLMSIAAIPLLIGAAEDYSVHMLMAMQRTGGDIALARAATGRAVLFCGLSSMIGFGSLAFAGNGGLSSLGIACSLGVAMTMLTALWLLPQWAARCQGAL